MGFMDTAASIAAPVAYFGMKALKPGDAPGSISGAPDYSAINARIAAMQGPQAVSGPGSYQDKTNSYQAKDMSKTALPQFDVMREQANTQANQNSSQKSDALQRRYASMGMLNSGAAADEANVQDQQNAQDKANTNLSIGAEQAQTVTGLQSQEGQKEFQSGEALSGRNFQGQMQNQGENLQANQFNTQAQQQFQQAQMGDSLAVNQMQESAAEAQYNAAMNAYTAKHTGGLLGSGGMLGTGIG